MRTVFINDECVRVNTGCGLRPLLESCGVQELYNEKEKIFCTTTSQGLFNKEIQLQMAKSKQKELAKRVQIICDSCRYSDVPRKR